MEDWESAREVPPGRGRLNCGLKCDWFRIWRASQLLITILLTPVEGTFAAACYGNGKRRRRQDLRGVAVGTLENV